MIFFQILAGLLVAWSYYMLAMMMTTYDGLPSLVLQPFMGAIFAFVAVFLCLLIGLPIRLVTSVRRFWRRLWWLPFVFGAVGFLLMVLSWTPFRQTVYDSVRGMPVQTFQPALALGGWLLSIFAALHFWFPLPRFFRRHSHT
jgi:hypothetical protein